MLSRVHPVIKTYCCITEDKIIYRTVITSATMYDSEVWTLNKSDENASTILGEKIKKEHFWPVKMVYGVSNQR